MKLDEQMIKLEENVVILLASKEHAETELMRVGKSMLKERDEFLAHSKAQSQHVLCWPVKNMLRLS